MAEKKAVVIKVREVSVGNMTDAAKGNATGQRKVKSSGNSCWAQTVLWMHGVQDLATYTTGKDVKDIAEAMRVEFKNAFLAEYEELPEQGRNARTGKIIDVQDGKGEIKWSSWEETKAPISYIGDLALIAKKGLVSELVVGELSVLGRTDILKRCKDAETPMSACERGLKIVTENYEGVNLTDLEATVASLEALYIKASQHVEDVKAAVKA